MMTFLIWRLETYLFNVVDLPEEGLPTRPIRGSRGMLWEVVERSKNRSQVGIKA